MNAVFAQVEVPGPHENDAITSTRDLGSSSQRNFCTLSPFPTGSLMAPFAGTDCSLVPLPLLRLSTNPTPCSQMATHLNRNLPTWNDTSYSSTYLTSTTTTEAWSTVILSHSSNISLQSLYWFNLTHPRRVNSCETRSGGNEAVSRVSRLSSPIQPFVGILTCNLIAPPDHELNSMTIPTAIKARPPRVHDNDREPRPPRVHVHNHDHTHATVTTPRCNLIAPPNNRVNGALPTDTFGRGRKPRSASFAISLGSFNRVPVIVTARNVYLCDANSSSVYTACQPSNRRLPLEDESGTLCLGFVRNEFSRGAEERIVVQENGQRQRSIAGDEPTPTRGLFFTVLNLSVVQEKGHGKCPIAGSRVKIDRLGNVQGPTHSTHYDRLGPPPILRAARETSSPAHETGCECANSYGGYGVERTLRSELSFRGVTYVSPGFSQLRFADNLLLCVIVWIPLRSPGRICTARLVYEKSQPHPRIRNPATPLKQNISTWADAAFAYVN
ncbi:uncharacterized protein LACBIDRAFT_294859 [Laccaria bicolor S238N-H82]|uniref:Predicted protein n=1 Tax=Laccaria bicolor (strain S238N-H82 / ATCC MYA-4686) TaxID=486041 RepID=B0DJ40_LACBS|nr:uncharacterized protein LACBIDRAFT_294859 [Laccaria bicolor S238N-H82]EDR05455.1 predicted protein [Laccaria bicolor S238N-H82]|eukprot:XP_001884013.1 predicted protein [Laccaria bicolor S238N-H82]